MSIGYSSGSTPYVNPANILVNAMTVTSPGATLLTIPAGRTWQGWVSTQIAMSAPAGTTTSSSGKIYLSIAGSGVTPSGLQLPNRYALLGADGSTGLDGQNANASARIPLTVVTAQTNSGYLVTEGSTSAPITYFVYEASGMLL